MMSLLLERAARMSERAHDSEVRDRASVQQTVAIGDFVRIAAFERRRLRERTFDWVAGDYRQDAIIDTHANSNVSLGCPRPFARGLLITKARWAVRFCSGLLRRRAFDSRFHWRLQHPSTLDWLRCRRVFALGGPFTARRLN